MIYRGKVTALATTGVYVTVTDLHPTQAFGPLRYAGAKPAVADMVLVAVVGSDETLPDMVVINPMQDPGDVYVAKSVVTTKGDLIAATASATVSRLAVAGNDVSKIVSDASTSTGLAWRQERPTIPVNNYFQTAAYVGSLSMSVTQGQHLFWLVSIPHDLTISELSFYVSTAAAAGATWRVGAWNLASNGYGVGSNIADFSTVDPTTIGKKTISSLSQAFSAGLVWFSVGLQGTGGGGGALFAGAGIPISYTSSMNGGYQGCLYANSITGALSGTPTIGGPAYASVPAIELKRSA